MSRPSWRRAIVGERRRRVIVSTLEQNHARRARRVPVARPMCTAVKVAIPRLLDRGTQCMSLSAATEHSKSRQGLPGPHARLQPLVVAKHSAIVDSDVVVGRRSRHRADVLGRRPQGPDSRRCHQRAAPCPLARVLAATSARRSAPSELFQPYVTHMYILLVQRAEST